MSVPWMAARAVAQDGGGGKEIYFLALDHRRTALALWREQHFVRPKTRLE